LCKETSYRNINKIFFYISLLMRLPNSFWDVNRILIKLLQIG